MITQPVVLFQPLVLKVALFSQTFVLHNCSEFAILYPEIICFNVSKMLKHFSLGEISEVNDSSVLTLLKYSTSFDEVIWALTWEAESVAGEIGAHTKNYLPLFVQVSLRLVLALFDLIFLFDLPWACCDFFAQKFYKRQPC